MWKIHHIIYRGWFVKQKLMLSCNLGVTESIALIVINLVTLYCATWVGFRCSTNPPQASTIWQPSTLKCFYSDKLLSKHQILQKSVTGGINKQSSLLMTCENDTKWSFWNTWSIYGSSFFRKRRNWQDRMPLNLWLLIYATKWLRRSHEKLIYFWQFENAEKLWKFRNGATTLSIMILGIMTFSITTHRWVCLRHSAYMTLSITTLP